MDVEFPYQTLIPLVAGSLARVVAVATLAPLEFIRTNFQASSTKYAVIGILI